MENLLIRLKLLLKTSTTQVVTKQLLRPIKSRLKLEMAGQSNSNL